MSFMPRSNLSEKLLVLGEKYPDYKDGLQERADRLDDAICAYVLDREAPGLGRAMLQAWGAAHQAYAQIALKPLQAD